MKVLIVSYLLDPKIGGGAATSALRLCEGLMQQGVEVVAVTTQNEKEPRVTDDSGMRVYSFRPQNLYWVADKGKQRMSRKVVWQGIDTWNPHVYRVMREIIRLESPDVVHVHKLRGLSPSIWSAAAAENRRPIVQTCRDYELISPEGLLESSVGRMAQDRHWLLRPYQAVRSRVSNSVHVVTAPSQFTLATITEIGLFSRSKKIVVPNTHGFTMARLADMTKAAIDQSSDDRGFRLLYLGRLETAKGINVLCQAFAEISQYIPLARLDIAGSGTREQALRLQYAGVPQIHFHGHLSGSEKDDLVSEATLLAMPTLVNEVFGNSIVETFAFGKPVIAFRIGGIPEIVTEGETGFLANPGDIEDLKRVILNAYSEPDRVRSMLPRCIEAARSYSLEAVTSSYIHAYEAGYD